MLGDSTGGERLVGQILAHQIGSGIEDMLTAWRIDGPGGAAVGDLRVTCETARDGSGCAVFVRVTHEQTGRVLFSGFRQQPFGPVGLLSENFVTKFAHSAASRSMSKLPQVVGLDRSESIATGFANLALRCLYAFDTQQMSEAAGLMGRAFDADRNGLYLAWQGFIHMAQVIDRPSPAGPALREEVDALASLTRMMLFDEFGIGVRLAESALAVNQGNLFARQSLAVAYGSAGRANTAYDVSRFCQTALVREDMRHLWDLYHCLVCIATNRLDEALETARKASARCPDFLAPRRQILALAVHVGDIEAARAQMRALERLEPGFTMDRFVHDPEYPVDTLGKSGLLNFQIAMLTG